MTTPIDKATKADPNRDFPIETRKRITRETLRMPKDEVEVVRCAFTEVAFFSDEHTDLDAAAHVVKSLYAHLRAKGMKILSRVPIRGVHSEVYDEFWDKAPWPGDER